MFCSLCHFPWSKVSASSFFSVYQDQFSYNLTLNGGRPRCENVSTLIFFWNFCHYLVMTKMWKRGLADFVLQRTCPEEHPKSEKNRALLVNKVTCRVFVSLKILQLDLWSEMFSAIVSRALQPQDGRIRCPVGQQSLHVGLLFTMNNEYTRHIHEQMIQNISILCVVGKMKWHSVRNIRSI